MAIDPSIPLRAEQFSLADVMRNVEALRNSQADRQFQQQRLEMAHQQQLDALDQRQREAAKERAGLIGEAAQWADTPEKWDRAVDWLVHNGHPDLAQYKGQFSPENRMAAISQAGQMQDYLERTAPPKPTALEQQIGLLRKYRPDMSDAQTADVIERGISGYSFSPDARQAKVSDQIAVIDHRTGQQIAAKQAPTYAQTHPKAGGGGGASKPSATRVVGGKAYYKIGGRWFDNPRGE